MEGPGTGEAGRFGLSLRYTVLHCARYADLSLRHAALRCTAGWGSSLLATAEIRSALGEVLREPRWAIRTLLDLPCGRFHWMADVLTAAHPGLQAYWGVDVSSVVTQENVARFALINRRRAGVLEPAGGGGMELPYNVHKLPRSLSFHAVDAVDGLAGAVMRGPSDGGGGGAGRAGGMLGASVASGVESVDLIFMRDLMIHLAPEDNLKLLRQVDALARAGKARYLMATTYLRADHNNDDFLAAAAHHPNLFRPPYCLRDALRLYHDGGQDNYMGLWELSPDTPLIAVCRADGTLPAETDFSAQGRQVPRSKFDA